jgi:membrane-bound lytic murein transglycosylase D
MLLCSCDVDSPGVFHENAATSYTKKINTKYGLHSNAASADTWFEDPPQITVSTGNFWDRLRGSFQLNHQCDNPKVKSQINWFIHHQGYLNRSVKRASPYMYYIFEQVQKRNLPGELLLLPFIESAFNPFAYSGPGAAGLWQFMPRTGSGFGLKQNWWYDGRRDIHASTNAALDYLTYLQSFFDGDWMLAFAAYNTGEGCVQQAVRRNARCGMNTDFFSLGLSQETQSYVPRLLALAAIISNPDDYPITLPAVRDEPYLAEVSIGCQIDLTEAAQLAGISTEEMHRLNPAYRHTLTGPRSSCKLLLPISHVETFKKNIASLSVVKQTSMQRYKVKRGESLQSIAAHFQIPTYALRHINHLKTKNVRPGKTILVPVESPIITGNIKESAEPANDTAQESKNKTTEASAQTEKSSKTENTALSETSDEPTAQSVSKESPQKITHRVKRGETLKQIAMHYHVNTKELQKWNHLAKTSKLKPGKTLTIFHKTDFNESDNPEHTIKTTRSSKDRKKTPLRRHATRASHTTLHLHHSSNRHAAHKARSSSNRAGGKPHHTNSTNKQHHSHKSHRS